MRTSSAVVAVNFPHFVFLLGAHDIPLEGLIIRPLLQTLQVVKVSNPVVSNLQKEGSPKIMYRVGNIKGGKFGSVIQISKSRFLSDLSIYLPCFQSIRETQLRTIIQSYITDTNGTNNFFPNLLRRMSKATKNKIDNRINQGTNRE